MAATQGGSVPRPDSAEPLKVREPPTPVKIGPAEDRELTAADILTAEDTYGPKKVQVPEWGGHVYVRRLEGTEKDNWIIGLAKQEPGDRHAGYRNVTARFVALVACDSHGNRLFRDADQVAALGRKFSGAMERVSDAARHHNLMDREDLENLAKKSEATQAGDSN